MRRLRHAGGVDRALRSLRVTIQKALRELNQAAAKVMGRGDYAAAEVLAAKGREIRQFQAEVETLRKRWRELRGRGGRGSKASATPLWSYYQPILRALVQAGGECRRSDLEPRVERLLGSDMPPGDRAAAGRGGERWRAMVRRARRHLVAEGWIENGRGPVWKITEAGRRAAEKPIAKSTPTSG